MIILKFFQFTIGLSALVHIMIIIFLLYVHIVFQVYLLTKEEGGRTKAITPYMNLQMFSRTWDCAAQVLFPGKEMVMPGEDAK